MPPLEPMHIAERYPYLRRLQPPLWEHLFAYLNAIPRQPENFFETLMDPDFFPAAQVALQAEEAQSTANPESYLNQEVG